MTKCNSYTLQFKNNPMTSYAAERHFHVQEHSIDKQMIHGLLSKHEEIFEHFNMKACRWFIQAWKQVEPRVK